MHREQNTADHLSAHVYVGLRTVQNSTVFTCGLVTLLSTVVFILEVSSDKIVISLMSRSYSRGQCNN
jgi:hypothetical protein